MSNNNHNHQPCDFSEALVSYLYGEINAAESEKFQAHAAKCVTCSAEIAGFSTVRSAVAEWRQEEFAPMASPAFELPARREVIITDESASWLDGIRAFFTPKVALAAAGFAAILLCAGLTFVVLNSNGSGDGKMMAENASPEKNKNEVSNETNTPDNHIATTVSNTEKESTASTAVPSEKNVKPGRQYVSTAPVKNNNVVAAPKQKDTPKATTAQKPKLDPNYVDDEDDSLRLADLFAEADTDDMN